MLRLAGARSDHYLSISDSSVAFRNTSEYWLDVDIFEEATARNRDLSGRELSPERVVELEEAVDLYVGDLLDCIYEEWVLYDREQLRLDYLNALDKLLVYHGINGDFEKALYDGGLILNHDNTREKTHRRMMWLHCLTGNRDAALTQYQRCCQILREELGVRPTAETRQLYELMRQEAFRPKHWPIDQHHPRSTRLAKSQSVHPLAKHALRKLQHLQQMIEESRAEARLIENLISEALLDTQEH
jgi:DNA-binding SARP family transcriptional activator